MRTLSASLLEAQRSSSARPYLRVRLFDRDVGVVRLRWQRWYSGSEPDGACVAAAPADGALVRARITPAGNALSAGGPSARSRPAAAESFSASESRREAASGAALSVTSTYAPAPSMVTMSTSADTGAAS